MLRLPRPSGQTAGRRANDHRTDEHASIRGNLQTPADPSRHLRDLLGRDDCSSIIWMIMADHLRPWKQVQREFQEIERAKLKATEARSSSKSSRRRTRPRSQEIDAADQGGQRRAQSSEPPTSSEIERELNGIGGEDRGPRHQAEIQESRARQPAQPLRRHDRTRARRPVPDLPEHDGHRGRKEAAPAFRATGGAEAKLRR